MAINLSLKQEQLRNKFVQIATSHYSFVYSGIKCWYSIVILSIES